MAYARRRRRHEGVLELTPLIDVIFLLLIFFMVSTSFVVNREIAIKLPQSTSAANEPDDQQLIMLKETFAIMLSPMTVPTARSPAAAAINSGIVAAARAASLSHSSIKLPNRRTK